MSASGITYAPAPVFPETDPRERLPAPDESLTATPLQSTPWRNRPSQSVFACRSQTGIQRWWWQIWSGRSPVPALQSHRGYSAFLVALSTASAPCLRDSSTPTDALPEQLIPRPSSTSAASRVGANGVQVNDLRPIIVFPRGARFAKFTMDEYGFDWHLVNANEAPKGVLHLAAHTLFE